jgi:hypothetical protein
MQWHGRKAFNLYGMQTPSRFSSSAAMTKATINAIKKLFSKYIITTPLNFHHVQTNYCLITLWYNGRYVRDAEKRVCCEASSQTQITKSYLWWSLSQRHLATHFSELVSRMRCHHSIGSESDVCVPICLHHHQRSQVQRKYIFGHHFSFCNIWGLSVARKGERARLGTTSHVVTYIWC